MIRISLPWPRVIRSTPLVLTLGAFICIDASFHHCTMHCVASHRSRQPTSPIPTINEPSPRYSDSRALVAKERGRPLDNIQQTRHRKSIGVKGRHHLLLSLHRPFLCHCLSIPDPPTFDNVFDMMRGLDVFQYVVRWRVYDHVGELPSLERAEGVEEPKTQGTGSCR